MPTREMKEKIGALFILGFEGRNISPALKDLLTRYHVGGLVYFSRNVSEPVQVWELMRSLAGFNLLHCIDHEGGRVVRLPEPVTRFPPAARFGEAEAAELVRLAANCQGAELAALGFNVNLAPVLDVLTNPHNPVIGDRAFSASPQAVAALGREYVRGLQEAGVVACGKHFPGHGDTKEDSHHALPRVKGDEATLAVRELVPFQAAFSAGLKMVMTAHVVYEGLDRTLPATLSPTVVDRLLRQRLRFGGAVVSDDLEMRAVADHWDLEERVILALRAGIDLLLFCHSADAQVLALEAVYKALDGRILRPEQIDRAFARVQELRKAARRGRSAGTKQELLAVLNRPEHKGLAASLG